MCSQILRCVLESRIQIHPTIGLHKWRKYGTNTDLTTEIQFVWHVLPGASTIDTNKLVQSRLNGLDPQLFEERTVFLSMFNDIDWTLEVKTEICLHNAKGVAAFASTFKPCMIYH